MGAASPTVEGFRAAFRRPAVSLAEVLWRWSVGATAILLFFFGTFEYLSGLPVTGGEILLLHSKQPVLVAKAIAHILRGNWDRGVAAALLAGLALILLWMLAASLGRMATVGSLLDYFRRDASFDNSGEGGLSAAVFQSLFRLSCLRIVVVLAAVCGIIGAAVLAGLAAPGPEPNPALAFLLFLFVAVLVFLASWTLTWLLSLAAVLEVRGSGGALASITSAVALCCERPGRVLAVSFWTGLAHLAVFVLAATVIFVPLALAGTVSWLLIALAMTLITLVYFAIADWIYIARLAGYVCILEMSEELPATPPIWPTPAGGLGSSTTSLRSTEAIDRDELILSDLPNLAPEG